MCIFRSFMNRQLHVHAPQRSQDLDYIIQKTRMTRLSRYFTVRKLFGSNKKKYFLNIQKKPKKNRTPPVTCLPSDSAQAKLKLEIRLPATNESFNRDRDIVPQLSLSNILKEKNVIRATPRNSAAHIYLTGAPIRAQTRFSFGSLSPVYTYVPELQRATCKNSVRGSSNRTSLS